MKLIFQITVFFLLTNLSCAQLQMPCTQLDSVMAISKEGPNELSVMFDKHVLFDCGEFDEVDRVLLFGNFLDNFMTESLKKYDTLSYHILLKRLKDVQSSPSYRASYEISKTRLLVLNSIADTVFFDQNSETFSDFFPNEAERIYVRSYIGKHQNVSLSFITILEQYTSEEQIQLDDQIPPVQFKNQVPFLAFYDLKTTLENAEYYKRPILLYFSSYTNVVSRTIESNWFYIDTINELMNKMTVYQIMCDERLPMDPDDVKYFKKKYKKTFSTYGEKNAFIEQKEFKKGTQPYFVLYTVTGKLIGKWEYLDNSEEFKRFLQLAGL
jgi:hypothetical protein